MITYNLKKVKFVKNDIKDYEETKNFYIFSCPCCNSENIIKWGVYTRNVVYFKNNKKYEMTIKIKRIKCKDCNKTQSIIPNFLVPYKVHILEYINEALKNKIIHNNTYQKTSKKYQISRQLLKYWLNCFEEHFKRISVMLLEIDKKKIIRKISKSLYDYIYEYYYENRRIYMMYIDDIYNMPILKWAPT